MSEQQPPHLTIYTTPGCVQCRMTINKFSQAGIEPQVIDLNDNPEAREWVTNDLGYSQAPIVVYGEEHWSGLRPDNITATVKAIQTNQHDTAPAAQQDTTAERPMTAAQRCGRSTPTAAPSAEPTSPPNHQRTQTTAQTRETGPQR